jgi:hypothetical protein
LDATWTIPKTAQTVGFGFIEGGIWLYWLRNYQLWNVDFLPWSYLSCYKLFCAFRNAAFRAARLHICFLRDNYKGVTKIFRTDAVKIIKLTIRPIGHHHPRSISLPHLDTGPTVSSILGTLPESHFLSEYQALSAIMD